MTGLPLPGGIEFEAHAAFQVLRAHAGGKLNSQDGLSAAVVSTKRSRPLRNDERLLCSPSFLDVDSFSDTQGVFKLDPQISDGAINFCVAK